MPVRIKTLQLFSGDEGKAQEVSPYDIQSKGSPGGNLYVQNLGSRLQLCSYCSSALFCPRLSLHLFCPDSELEFLPSLLLAKRTNLVLIDDNRSHWSQDPRSATSRQWSLHKHARSRRWTSWVITTIHLIELPFNIGSSSPRYLISFFGVLICLFLLVSSWILSLLIARFQSSASTTSTHCPLLHCDRLTRYFCSRFTVFRADVSTLRSVILSSRDM